MNFFRIAFRDISSIFKNRFIRVSVTAIVIVPLLYSLLYLDAFWDPYSKLDSMPVAIVNQDVGGNNDGKQVNYGNELVDKLKKDTRIGFRFVSEEVASKGLKNSKGYYAMFVVPKDFTQTILKAKDGNPEVAKILYKSNDKKNFLAAQINGKVVLELKREITKNIVEEDTKIVFDKLYEVKDGMKKAADGSDKLFDGLEAAKDGSKELSDGLSKLNTTAPALKSGVEALYNGSGQLSSGIFSAYNGAAKLFDGSSMLNSGLFELSKQVPVLSEGVQKLFDGSSELNNGVKSARDGLSSKIVPGSESLAQGLNKLYLGLAGAADGANKLASAADNLKNGAASLNNAEGQISNGQAALMLGVTKQDGLANSAAAIMDGANKLKSGAALLKPGMNKLVEGANSIKLASNGVSSGVDGLISKMNLSQSTLKNAVDTQLGAYLKANPSAASDPNMQKFLATLSALNAESTNTNNLSQISALQSGVHQLSTGANDLSSGVNEINLGFGLYADNAIKFSEGAILYSTGAGQFVSGAKVFVQGTDSFVKGSSQFADGTKEFAGGAVALGNGIKDAVNGSKALNDGASSLNTALKGDLLSGLTTLAGGSEKLNLGLSDLNSKVPQLTEGINKLFNGSTMLKNGLGKDEDRAKLPKNLPASDSNETLLSGINKLNSGSQSLKGGLNTLNNNIPSLEDGTRKLYNGSIDLTSGLGKLYDGSKELKDKLSEGYDELDKNLVISSKDMGKYVSEPIQIDETSINPIHNYGTGFTPYFIPLSLWVGAMLMFFVISDKVDEDIKASSASLVLGKFISYCYIGIIQAVLASIVVIALGLRPSNIVAYFGFNILMSLSFIAIIQCFVFLLGDPGRLIAIVLLILQLTSCAGTFPLEVVPKFFKILNPIMPFTYCVSGLREIISGIDHSVLALDTTVLFGIMFAFLLISISLKRHADKLKDVIVQKKTA